MRITVPVSEYLMIHKSRVTLVMLLKLMFIELISILEIVVMDLIHTLM